MASIEFAGFVYDGSGAAVSNATINLYDRNTVTPVRATTTTNASGYWTITHATEGRFDIEIVNGTTTRRIKYDSAIQLQELETANLLVRNPANTFKYDIVPAAITADRQLNLPLITATRTLVANNTALADNESIIFGTGADASILYDGTNLVINPILVGAGVLDLAAGILELNNAVRFDTGVAMVAASYSIGRDADATNQLHANVPTGATFEWSVNDVAQMTLSATAVDFLDNSITTTGALTIASFGANWTNASRTVADLGIVTTVDINGGTLDGVTIGGAAAAAATVTTLTLDQGSVDTLIQVWRSSDITTGLTTLPQLDVGDTDYFVGGKQHATNGGVVLQGMSVANIAYVMQAYSETDVTTKATNAGGPFMLQVIRHAGANDLGTFTADSNLLIISEEDSGGVNTRYIFDVEGSAHADVAWTTFDAYDDLALIHDIEQYLLDRESAAGTYSRHALEAAGIIGRDSWHFENGKPRAMVNMTKLAMLHHGALIQVGQRLDERDERIAALEGQITELRNRLEAGRN